MADGTPDLKQYAKFEPVEPQAPAAELARDPIVYGSLNIQITVASVMLVLASVWVVYAEVYGNRPWKGYQKEFVSTYRTYLTGYRELQTEKENALRSAPEYTELGARIESLQQANTAREQEITTRIGELSGRIDALQNTVKYPGAEVTALIYQIEVAEKAEEKEALRAQLDTVKNQPFDVKYAGGEVEALSFNQMQEQLVNLKDERTALLSETAKMSGPVQELRNLQENFVKQRLDGLTAQQVDGLLGKLDGWKTEIKQIHVPVGDLIDRCESCHAAIREPIRLTSADMGGRHEFTSHPRPELLKIHDPERFGCSPCHGGNGIAVNSVEQAHGKYKHWLWPLYDRENVEAGCLQCHEQEMHLPHAPTLNRGRELFQRNGCFGCHYRQGYDSERIDLLDLGNQMRNLQARRDALKKEFAIGEQKAADRDTPIGEVAALRARSGVITLELSQLNAEEQQLHLRQKGLMIDRKKIGPNLKEIKAKLKPEWIPVWLKDTHAFRPGTKMPSFRLTDDQIHKIAAFLWQSAIDMPVPAQPAGNAERGKELFEKRGCLGCHSMGEGINRIGDEFSANLSRVGEKAGYDYLVRWIQNPRQRLLPYSPAAKRDITPEDYQAKGLPFVFDREHSRCPQTGEEMVVEQMTVMPDLRLSDEEARDIASYLMTMKHADAAYEPAPYMNDAALFEEGKALVKHYGCAGCHEIRGLEEESGIGTELTKAGTKPLDRLDFGLLTHDAKRWKWHDHKGFYSQKLRNPALYDEGKEKAWDEKLRMPNFNLPEEDLSDIVTFLLGSVDSRLPASYYANPTDRRKAIAEGWWVVKKYNCTGCHQIAPDEKPQIQSLPWFQGDKIVNAPPLLVGQGARTNPEWLAEFLRNPALRHDSTDRNGVREYLDIRMPTFALSENEIGKLVRFFNALANQPEPYPHIAYEPVAGGELDVARELFIAADCLKCHAGATIIPEVTIAPSFLLTPERLKSEWNARWLLDPATISPGTRMPSGLFRREGERWILLGELSDKAKAYSGDHVDLFVRYLRQFDDKEAQVLETMKKR